MKNVVASAESLMSKLQEGADLENTLAGITPEQALLYWINYHLKEVHSS